MCNYCKGGKICFSKTTEIKLSLITTEDGVRVIETECNPCPEADVHCALQNVPARSVTIINYCPYCGRDLRFNE